MNLIQMSAIIILLMILWTYNHYNTLKEMEVIEVPDIEYITVPRIIKKPVNIPIKIHALKVKKFKTGFSINNKDDVLWLTRNIYFEGRGESDEGKMAIAMVTLNRVRKNEWPNTIKEVVTEPFQFSWYNDSLKTGKIPIMKNKESMYKCRQIAISAIKSYNRTFKEIWGKATYYHNNKISLPKWAKRLSYICSIDNHLLYKEDVRLL